MRSILSAWMLLVAFAASAAQNADVLGAHDLSAGAASVRGGNSAACLYCHAPHSGNAQAGPLWDQTLSTQTYTLYSSSTLQNTTTQPKLGGTSVLCLSCHDGTVAVGQMVPYGPIDITGKMTSVFKTKLETSHPFSLNLPLQDAADVVRSLAEIGKTADPTGSVKLIKGNIECNSCHTAHNQNIDKKAPEFLVRDNANSGLCLSCHTLEDRTVKTIHNPLRQWAGSVHAISVAQIKATTGLPGYTTVAELACLSCHTSHNAGQSTGLLRNLPPPASGIDTTSQSCLACHSGSASLLQPITNVFAEMAKAGHPYPSSTSNTHTPTEPVILVQNRHATCVDCHDGHASKPTSTFNDAPQIRPSQNGASGVGTDGTALSSPATMQYQTCLRCHGPGAGKQLLPTTYGYLPVRVVSAADPLNVTPEFAVTSSSSHPVMHTTNSPWPQPSLRSYMLMIDGTTNSSRMLGSGQAVSIFCTDCHNADDNREFGGSGPTGTHGSQYSHMLERRYEFSQVAAGAGPGTSIQNLYITPDVSAGGSAPGPYALCGKCHDLSKVLADTSFRPGATAKGGHFTHISDQGISCAVCHTAHGLGSLSANITGERLVNFDLNVVAPNGNSPISYSRATNTCVLTCHLYNHNSDGTVTPAPPRP